MSKNIFLFFRKLFLFCKENKTMIRHVIQFVTSISLINCLNFVKVECHFRMSCMFSIFVLLTILHGSYTAPSPSPQVSAIPEKRKKWCMKILKGTFYISWKILWIMAVIFLTDLLYRWIPWSSYRLSEGKDEERNE